MEYDRWRDFLLEFRITALPDAALHLVLHAAGSHTRCVSRHWCHTYGPLCSLRFRDLRHTQAALALAARHPTRYHTVTSLNLNYSSQPASATLAPDDLASLAASFPNLQQLLLSNYDSPTDDLALLAPLAPTLTSLSLVSARSRHVLTLPLVLPSLRTLRVSMADMSNNDAIAALGAVSQLQQLQSLQWSARRLPSQSALQCLSPLRYLTYLDICGPGLCPSDDCSAALLRTAFPGLKSLALHISFAPPAEAAPTPRTTAAAGDAPPAGAAPFHVLAASLASLTALSSLSLAVTSRSVQVDAHGVACYGRTAADLRAFLQLTSLNTLSLSNCDVDPRAIACAAACTNLRVGCSVGLLTGGWPTDGLPASCSTTAAASAPSAAMSPVLQVAFDDVSEEELVIWLTCLPALQQLKVRGGHAWPGTPLEVSQAAAAATTSLSQLSSLEVFHDVQFLNCVMAQLPQFTGLRRLTLELPMDSWAEEALAGLASAGRSLTQLILDRGPFSNGVQACMMHAIRQMQRLRSLQLWPVLHWDDEGRFNGESDAQQMVRLLLPLPPGLTELRLADTVPDAVPAELRAAAGRQGCVLVSLQHTMVWRGGW